MSNLLIFTPHQHPAPMTLMTHPTSYETFTDHKGNQIKFLLTFLDLRSKYCVAASEMTENENPRIFHGYDTESMEAALTKVRKVITEELNTLYFTADHKNPFAQLNGDLFRGYVGDHEDGEPFIVVDGKEMTLEDLGEFLKPLMGFRIEVRVLD